VALLVFPTPAFNGQIYPATPLPGQNVYQWDAAEQTWRLIGTATGVIAGTYGTPLQIPQFTVDPAGRITFAQNVDIQKANKTQLGVVQIGNNISVDASSVISVPVSSTGTPGVVSPGSTVNVSGLGVLNVNTATTAAKGVVQVGNNLNISGSGILSVPLATSSTAGVIVVGSNLQTSSSGVLTVRTATTSVQGATTLVNDTTTNDSTKALTAAAGFNLQQQIDAINISSNITFVGTIDATTENMVSVTAEGTLKGFVVGQPLPFPAPLNKECLVIVEVAGSLFPPGPGVPTAVSPGDWILSDGNQWIPYVFNIGTVIQINTGTGLTGGPITTNGTISLVPATTTDLGGVIIDGTTIAVSPSGLISVEPATTSTLGGVIPDGTTIAVSPSGLISVEPATTSTLGGVIPDGTSIAVSPTGAISVVFPPMPSLQDVTDVGAITTNIIDVAGLIAASLTYPLTDGTPGQVLSTNGFGILGWSTASSAISVTAPIIDTGTPTASIIGIQDATTGQLGAVQVGTNIDVAAGVISVKSSTTAQSGIVQLNDTVSSTSATEALTAKQGKALQDQISTLAVTSNLTLAGTFDATASQMLTVTSQGTSQSFVIGNNLPAAAAGNLDYFVIVTTGGSYNPPGGGGPYTANQGDWFLSNGTSWQFLNVGSDLPTASTGTAGIVELATVLETQTGTDTTIAVTPAGAAATYLPISSFAAKGNILSATGANTPAALPVGANGQVLVACSTAATGLCWTAIPQATPTASGTLLGCTIGTNVALGFQSQASGAPNLDNVSAGFATLCSITTGFQNTAIGHIALCSLATGNQNVAIGSSALCAMTSGLSNDAVGALAMHVFTSGNYNVSFGGYSLFNYTSGCFNTAIGHRALTAVTTGGCNTVIGGYAGENITTGTCNVMLGHYTHAADGTASCQLTIGYATAAWWIRGDGAKNICLGAGLRDSSGSLGTNSQYLWSTGGGICWASSSPSDARDKNIHGAIETALPLVNSIEAVSYNWKPRTTGIEEQELVYGFVAQQLQEVDPILVDAEDPENLRIHDRKITPLLVRAIQELSEEVKNLREELNKLKVQS
jgi:hypothetical protein